MRVAVLCLAALAAVLAARVEPARACSCAIGDPRTALAAADAAFVGTLLERRVAPDSQQATLVFRVEEAVKGGLGRRIEVDTASSGAACGIELEVGQRIGLFLDRDGGRWRGTLCGQVEPERLRAAARPFPRPDGKGPVALVVGGRFGPVRTIALDRRGRTLAYGKGAGEAVFVSVCPGALRTVELVLGDRVVLAVRALPTLRLVRQRTLPLAWRGSSPAGLWCRDRDAQDVLVFATDLNRPAGNARLLRVRARGVATAWRGTALAATARAGRVYLAGGTRADKLLALELGTGRSRVLGALPPFTGSLALSPDGSLLAGIAYGAPLGHTPQNTRLVLADVGRRGGELRTVSLGHPNLTGDVLWTAPERLLVTPRGETDLVRLYDASLRVRASFHGWQAHAAALVGSTVWGVDYTGGLVAAQLPRGPVRPVRELPGPTARALVPVR